MVINGVDTKEFGIRVERLCEFLLDRIPEKTGSTEQRIIEDIKEEAIKLQTDEAELSFSGLESYMKGIPE